MRKKCPDCNGKKKIALFTSVVECETCEGTGSVAVEYEQDWAMVEQDETPTEELEDDIMFDLGAIDWNSLIP